jgi:hypothetical protein
VEGLTVRPHRLAVDGHEPQRDPVWRQRLAIPLAAHEADEGLAELLRSESRQQVTQGRPAASAHGGHLPEGRAEPFGLARRHADAAGSRHERQYDGVQHRSEREAPTTCTARVVDALPAPQRAAATKEVDDRCCVSS